MTASPRRYKGWDFWREENNTFVAKKGERELRSTGGMFGIMTRIDYAEPRGVKVDG